MQTNKLRNCLRVLLFSLVTAFVPAGCTKEDLSACYKPYRLTVVAYDADNMEVPSEQIKDIVLYIFDKDKTFIGTQSATIGKSTELNYKNPGMLHVVAWGNSGQGGQAIPALHTGDHLETAFLTLNKTKNSLPSVQSPDDLFYGALQITEQENNTDHIIAMSRKISGINITIRKLKEYAAVTDEKFELVVRKSTDKLDFYGKPNGADVAYAPRAAFNDKKEFVTPNFNILSTASNIEIDINHDGRLLTTVIADSNGNSFKAVEGKLLNILVDFSGNINVEVSVTPWGKKQIWKEF